MSSPDYLYDEVLRIFLFCIDVVAHFISSGVCKTILLVTKYFLGY